MAGMEKGALKVGTDPLVCMQGVDQEVKEKGGTCPETIKKCILAAKAGPAALDPSQSAYLQAVPRLPQGECRTRYLGEAGEGIRALYMAKAIKNLGTLDPQTLRLLALTTDKDMPAKLGGVTELVGAQLRLVSALPKLFGLEGTADVYLGGMTSARTMSLAPEEFLGTVQAMPGHGDWVFYLAVPVGGKKLVVSFPFEPLAEVARRLLKSRREAQFRDAPLALLFQAVTYEKEFQRFKGKDYVSCHPNEWPNDGATVSPAGTIYLYRTGASAQYHTPDNSISFAFDEGCGPIPRTYRGNDRGADGSLDRGSEAQPRYEAYLAELRKLVLDPDRYPNASCGPCP